MEVLVATRGGSLEETHEESPPPEEKHTFHQMILESWSQESLPHLSTIDATLGFFWGFFWGLFNPNKTALTWY